MYNDSLFNEAVRKKTEQAEIRDEFDKKEVIIKAERDKRDAQLENEKKRQQFIEYCLLGGLVLMLALAFFVFRGYQIKRKANLVMAKQKELVEQKNVIIESKNKAITDSINYAYIIQNAMLVPEEKIKQGLKDYFILYKPKDIVSGDFYFFKERPAIVGHTHKNLIAACDCTGHGVPGAFMSLIGNEKLHDAIERSSDIGGALKLLNKNIKSALHQSTERDSTRDGMDIALCSVSALDASRAALSKGLGKEGQTILRYAGANRPLWMIRKGKAEVEEIRATKNSIGGFTDDTAEFETHTRYLDKGDTFYLFTDGYTDQFGGTEGKKLTTKRFREFLISVRDHTMAEQKQKLKKYLDEWRGPHEQVDDILVIGVRV
jgi:serine phosphatase RsbU (regulator of sigma subunit)